MIGRLSGTLVEKNPPQILLDVQGVAYEVDVPMSTFYNLPGLGDPITLFTHLVVREDAHLLFGFLLGCVVSASAVSVLGDWAWLLPVALSGVALAFVHPADR